MSGLRVRSSRTGRYSGPVLAAAAVLVLASGVALASKVTWRIESRDTDNNGSPDASFYVFTVVPAAGESVKDFHVTPPPGVDQPVRGTPKDPDGASGPWTTKKGRTSLNWYSGGQAQAGASMSFEVQLPASGYTRQDGSWKTTSDGNADPDDQVIDWGPRSRPTGADLPIYVPIAQATATPLDPPLVGAPMAVLVSSSVKNSSYRMYMTDEPVPDQLDDSEVSAFAADHEVPQEWGLLGINFSGFLGIIGRALAILVVPDDLDLVGRTVYLTVVVTDAAGGQIRSASVPVRFIL